MITIAGEPVARIDWNGTIEIALLGKYAHSKTAVIRGQQHPDMVEALTILGLDIAEIRAARMPLRCSAFSKAITNLGRRLKAAGLMTPVAIESRLWWDPAR